MLGIWTMWHLIAISNLFSSCWKKKPINLNEVCEVSIGKSDIEYLANKFLIEDLIVKS